MTGPIISEDGNWAWNGKVWVPNNVSQQKISIADSAVSGDIRSNNQAESMQNIDISDSVIMGDVVQNTTVLTYKPEEMKSMILSVLSEVGLNINSNTFDFNNDRPSNLSKEEKLRVENVLNIVEAVKPDIETSLDPDLEYQLACASYKIGRNQECLSHLNNARVIYEKINKIDKLCEINDALGQCYARLGDYYKAKQMFEKAMFNAEQIGDHEKKIVFSFYSYNAYTSQGDHERKKSSKMLKKIYSLSKKHSFSTEFKWIESAILRSMIPEDLKKNRKKALRIITNANNIDMQNNLKPGIGKNCNQLGRVMLANEEYLKAIKYFKEAIDIWNDLDDDYSKAYSLRYLGEAYKFRRDIPEAIRFFNQSLTLFEYYEEKKQIAVTLNHLSFMYGMKGDFPTSESYAQESLSVFREINSFYGEMMALDSIGKSFEARGDYAKARYYYSEKDKIASELNS